MAAILGWVQRRWNEVLEPVVSRATVEQEAQLREVWERELDWWKHERGLAGDSLRKPITQVQLKNMLKPFGIGPDQVRPKRLGGKQLRGYRRSWFEDAWERYL